MSLDIKDFKADEMLRYGIDPNILLVIHIKQFLLNPIHESPIPTMPAIDGSLPSVFNGHDSILPSVISGTKIKELARYAAICCAFFHGFETIEHSTADTLAQLIADKLNRMSGQLRILGDRQKRGRQIAFTNPVHQILHMHALPAADLCDFYHTRVIRPSQFTAEKYHSIAEKNKLKWQRAEENK